MQMAGASGNLELNDLAARIAHEAVDRNLTLREAARRHGVSADLFDAVVVSLQMTRPDEGDTHR